MKASRVTRICFTLSGIKDYRISGMAEIIAGSAHGLIEQGRKFTQAFLSGADCHGYRHLKVILYHRPDFFAQTSDDRLIIFHSCSRQYKHQAVQLPAHQTAAVEITSCHLTDNIFCKGNHFFLVFSGKSLRKTLKPVIEADNHKHWLLKRLLCLLKPFCGLVSDQKLLDQTADPVCFGGKARGRFFICKPCQFAALFCKL